MNITYIIGNGFDRNIGLHTSYSEFLDDYIGKPDEKITEKYPNEESSEEIIKWFKRNLKQKKDDWSDAEKEFGRFTAQIGKRNNPGLVFEICYKDFVEGICSYLEIEQRRISSKKISRDTCYNFFDSLQNYTCGLKPRDINSINDHFDKIDGGETYNLLSFNYTNVLDLICDTRRIYNIGMGHRKSGFINEFIDVINTHGCIKNNNVIFGVDNDNQIKDLSIFNNCHASVKANFVKSLADDMYGEFTDKTSNDVLQRSDLIYIYGCSLGETDLTWWQRIIRLMKEKTDVYVIVYSFELHKISGQRTFIDKERMVDSVKTKLLSYCSENDNTSLKERIYVTGEDVFGGFAEKIRLALSTKE